MSRSRVQKILAAARTLGEVRVDGRTVVYRGPITDELSHWEQMFVGRSKPVRAR